MYIVIALHSETSKTQWEDAHPGKAQFPARIQKLPSAPGVQMNKPSSASVRRAPLNAAATESEKRREFHESTGGF
jgi:hypothetical protein